MTAHGPAGRQERCLARAAWTNGTWEYDASVALPYSEQEAAAAKANPQSQNIRISQMCASDVQQSWRWRWRSHNTDCPFEYPSRAGLCHRFAGKRILLYGDSLTQQLFVSLASLAGNGTVVPRPDVCARVKPLECARVCDGSTLLCHRLRFGLTLDNKGFRLPPLGNCSVRPSGVVAPLSETFYPPCIRSFDLVMLHEFAHWVGADGMLHLEECLQRSGVQGAARLAQTYVVDLYKGQMHRNAAFLSNATHHERTRVLLRTAVPGYPPPDVLAPDVPHGAPPVFIAPRSAATWAHEYSQRESSRWNHHLWARMNAVARHAYRENGLGIMDAEAPMLQRVDGHLDELHYCLPGEMRLLRCRSNH